MVELSKDQEIIETEVQIISERNLLQSVQLPGLPISVM